MIKNHVSIVPFYKCKMIMQHNDYEVDITSFFIIFLTNPYWHTRMRWFNDMTFNIKRPNQNQNQYNTLIDNFALIIQLTNYREFPKWPTITMA